MDQKQRLAFKVWQTTTEAIRAWIQANPGQEVPTALVDALVVADQAYKAIRSPTPAPEVRRG